MLTALMLLGAVLCWAQGDKGTITGTVTDGSDAAIPKVKVTIKHIQTGIGYPSETNEAGLYIVSGLPAGTYQVTFESPGFANQVQQGIELGIADIRRVHAVLQPGSVQQTIEVRAQVNELKTDVPEVSVSLDTKTLMSLPVLAMNGGRNPEAFAYKVAPSVYGDNWTGYIGGGTEASKEVLLDGVSVTMNRAGAFGENAPSVEALQEFKIQTFGYSAEYGRFQAGLFSFEMKSGTNDYHGTGYSQLNNEIFDANSFNNNAAGQRKGKDRQWDVAGSFGGPVKLPKIYDGKNRTFFYFTFEKHRLYNGMMGGYDRTNPIADFYNGDFSRLLEYKVGTDAAGNDILKGAQYDPTTARQLADGNWTATMFPGNKIPVSRFSKVSQNLNAIMQKYYLPTVTDASTGLVRLQNNAQYRTNSTPRWDQVNYSLKLDHLLTDTQRLSGSYSRTQRPRFQVAGSDSNYLWNPNYDDGGPLSSSRNLQVNTDLARLGHDWTINPTLLNHFTVFLNRVTTLSGVNGTSKDGVDGAALLGIPNLKTLGYPVVNWRDGNTIQSLSNPGFMSNAFYADQSSGVTDTLTKVKGRHVIKFGVDHRRYVANTNSSNYVRFDFNSASTSIPGSPYTGTYTGSGFASYLLGNVYSGSITPPTNAGGRRLYSAAFVQDDFKMTRNLTVNLGMRWEYNSPHREVQNRMDAWDPTLTDASTGMKGAYIKAGSCDTGCTGRDYFGTKNYKAFGPRLGVAWQPTQKWTVRASYAILFEGDSFNGVYGSPNGTSTQNAWGGTWYMSAASTNPWNGIFGWDSGVPQSLYHPTQFNPAWGNSNSPTMIDPRYGAAPYIQNWNLNVQRELPGHVVVDAGYAGSKGTRLRDSELYNYNQISLANVMKFGSLLGNTVASPDDAAKYGITYPYAGFKGTLAQALKPFPNVTGNITDWSNPVGFSTYNSLIVQATKKASHGVMMNVSFNWQKSLTNVESSLAGSNRQAMDTYNASIEKKLASGNVPESLRGWIGWELPVGKGRKFAGSVHPIVDAFIGGWAAYGVFTYDHGSQNADGRQGSISSYYNGYRNRLNIAPGQVPLDNVNAETFNAADISKNPTTINTSLLTVPTPGTVGSGAVNYGWDTSKPQYNEDLSLSKSFRFAERAKVSLRLESFNLLNRHMLTSLDLTPTDKYFGKWTSVDSSHQLPRSAQVSMRLEF